jgi:YaiO family outer membrane protein
MLSHTIPRFITTAAASAMLAHPATAQSTHSVKAEAETEGYSRNFGSRKFTRLEYKYLSPDTTVVASAVAGVKKTGATKHTSFGGGVTLYQKFSPEVSTQTNLFVSQNEPVFAKLDITQDVTSRVFQNTTVTVGGRYAQFFEGQDVWFLQGGARHYFPGGSVAYRLSYVDRKGKSAFLAHLVNLSVRDPGGRGETRLWLGVGETSLTGSQISEDIREKNYGATIQRVQPLTGPLAVTLLAGISSFDRPAGSRTSTKLGLGLSTSFGGSRDRFGK